MLHVRNAWISYAIRIYLLVLFVPKDVIKYVLNVLLNVSEYAWNVLSSVVMNFSALNMQVLIVTEVSDSWEIRTLYRMIFNFYNMEHLFLFSQNVHLQFAMNTMGGESFFVA